MWTTEELKERGKAASQANYWPSVLAGIVLLATSRAAGGGGGGNSFSRLGKDIQSGNMSTEEMITIVTVLISVIAVSVIVAYVFKIFLTNPIHFGCRKFFLENSYGPANIKEMVYAFSSHYKNVMAAGFMKDLYLFLWGLLFIIPRIIKSYSYMMVPYIIADNPEMSANEAITRSREMMDGQKWNVFCMQLSFLGWFILDCCTLFILGVFYVHPWYYATEAELYRSLKGDAGTDYADETFVPTQTYENDTNMNMSSSDFPSFNNDGDF